MAKSQYIVLDFETTGFNKYHNDEVVQFAIINQNDEVLYNELCRPRHHFSWPGAQKVHHISPLMVKDKKPFDEYIDEVKNVFEQYDFIVCYNVAFEQGILQNYGFDISKYQFRDPMKEFAPIYGEKGTWGYKWKSLTVCADYFGYQFQAHDALEDVKATRFCFDKIVEYQTKQKQSKQVSINNWQSLFQPSIVSRGQALYQEDKVAIIFQDENQIVGNVAGSENYLVSLMIANQKIKKLSCSCPYASRGRRCKHMAALLFKVNE
ncbi:exonuclease domain-containing protein [uncultured Thomasclavelia sp.]|uniref:exonuclease domain-containing protein n=1 Tax=uncultured Thomasclavelia sp. TaxID=3025759 RepID=UPI0025E5AE0F|nr:exonuclease domain-containing protein [uncultured Thomasclavelia sp.]